MSHGNNGQGSKAEQQGAGTGANTLQEEKRMEEIMPLVDSMALEDDDLNDWSIPANYTSLKLESELGQQAAWQCVKRPWKPRDDQLTPGQKAARERKKRLIEKQAMIADNLKKQQQANGPNTADSVDDGEDEDEPGDDGEENDKFHYYWCLAVPKPYQRAGAVGIRWRPVWYPNVPEEAQQDLYKSVGWVNEAYWKSYVYGKQNAKTVVIYTLQTEAERLVPSKDDISSLFSVYKCSFDQAEEKRNWLIHHVNKTLGTDDRLLKAAQMLMTKSTISELEAQATSNFGQSSVNTGAISIFRPRDDAPSVSKFPFQFVDGTFAYTNGERLAKETPTVEGSGDTMTARLYVKLRSKQVKLLQVAGGAIKTVYGDTFILKSKLDELAGVVIEPDPTNKTLTATNEGEQWKSDSRKQYSDEVSSYQGGFPSSQ